MTTVKLEQERCSFCNRHKINVKRMIQNHDGNRNICDRCIKLAHTITADVSDRRAVVELYPKGVA